jgi:hypothetical protein
VRDVTDRLTLAHALEEANIARGVAEKIATEIYDAITANVATKQDLQQLETALRTDMQAMEQRLDPRFAALDTRFEQLERRIDTMVNRLVATMVVTLGLLFGALHLWPPHP